jgi:phage-related protein
MEIRENHNSNGELSREAEVITLDEVLECIDALNPKLAAKISGAIEQLGTGKTKSLLIKQLRGKIMELSVKQYRVIFCRAETIIYIVDIFKKQSRKTPGNIIKKAEETYRKIQNLQ